MTQYFDKCRKIGFHGVFSLKFKFSLCDKKGFMSITAELMLFLANKHEMNNSILPVFIFSSKSLDMLIQMNLIWGQFKGSFFYNYPISSDSDVMKHELVSPHRKGCCEIQPL